MNDHGVETSVNALQKGPVHLQRSRRDAHRCPADVSDPSRPADMEGEIEVVVQKLVLPMHLGRDLRPDVPAERHVRPEERRVPQGRQEHRPVSAQVHRRGMTPYTR